jgi:tRNA threonylcarbamoyladenosine biosynthesis protein TsaE
MERCFQPPRGGWQCVSESEAQTEQLGGALAGLLQPGMVVALIGELGAGKTRLVQAVAEAMGVDRRLVNSPTFVLVQEYDAPLRLYHFDAYRLADVDEFRELGAEELMNCGGICLIEWADRVSDALPEDLLRIEIEITAPTSREFRFHGSGPLSSTLVAELRGLLELEPPGERGE